MKTKRSYFSDQDSSSISNASNSSSCNNELNHQSSSDITSKRVRSLKHFSLMNNTSEKKKRKFAVLPAIRRQSTYSTPVSSLPSSKDNFSLPSHSINTISVASKKKCTSFDNNVSLPSPSLKHSIDTTIDDNHSKTTNNKSRNKKKRRRKRRNLPSLNNRAKELNLYH